MPNNEIYFIQLSFLLVLDYFIQFNFLLVLDYFIQYSFFMSFVSFILCKLQFCKIVQCTCTLKIL